MGYNGGITTMGGRAGGGGGRGMGGGSRAIRDNDFTSMSKALAKRISTMSDKERYEATQALANEIKGWADFNPQFLQGGFASNRLSAQQDESLSRYLKSVQQHGGFAGDVASSVQKSLVRFGHLSNSETVAKMSSKQAWVLAKAGMEHAIPTFGNMHIKTAWTSKNRKGKTQTHYDFKPIVPLVTGYGAPK